MARLGSVDFYSLLGLERDASGEDISRAFKRLAKLHHPDRNPDDPSAEESFKEAAEAFEVLSDQEKRGLYDRFGHEAGDNVLCETVQLLNSAIRSGGTKQKCNFCIHTVWLCIICCPARGH